MSPQDELPLFAALDDERFAAVTAGRRFLAPEPTLGRDTSDGRFLAIGAGHVPAHAGSDPQRLVVLLASGDDQVVVAAWTECDDPSCTAALGRHADVQSVGAVRTTDVPGGDIADHESILPSRPEGQNSASARYRSLGLMAYSAYMSHHSMEPRGARDFSSPQIRVRGANDFRHYSNQRLRLPNERPPLGPRIRRTIGALLTLAVVGGIGVGVYFGVTLLIQEDDAQEVEVTEVTDATESVEAEENGGQAPASGQESTADASTEEPTPGESATEADETEQASNQATRASDTEETQDQPSQTQPSLVSVSSIEPTVSVQQVTPAQLNGAEIVVERLTAEPIPSGIPRTLADGADYDPTEPATVFTSRWPVGTTLRLTRLPGATVLSDEQQAEVVGTTALVVVRGTESSNTDLQLSPAAFGQIAFYGTERIIAVRVEVTAPPPP